MRFYKKEFMWKDFSHNFIIIIFIFFFNINLSSSEIIKSSEFLPISKNFNIIELGIYHHPFTDNYSIDTENQQYIYNNSSMNFGFLKNISNREIAVNIRTSSMSKKTKFSKNNSQDTYTNIDFSIGLEEKFILNRKWESKIKFLYNSLYNEDINCFISKNIVIGGSPENCKIVGKEFVSNKVNGFYNPAINYDAHLLGFSIDLKKKSYDWSKKDTFAVAFQSNYIDFDNTLNTTFLEYEKDFSTEIPQENPWIENNLKLSLTRSYALKNNWSIAGGVELFYLNRLNYKKASNEKENNSNIKFETRLTKRLNDYYITIGGFNSLNYLLGLEPLLYNNLSHKSFNQHYSQIFVNLGKFINSNIETYENNSPKENPYIEIEEAVKKTDIKMLDSSKNENKKDKPKNIKNSSDLYEFAISYARSYDFIKNDF